MGSGSGPCSVRGPETGRAGVVWGELGGSKGGGAAGRRSHPQGRMRGACEGRGAEG